MLIRSIFRTKSPILICRVLQSHSLKTLTVAAAAQSPVRLNQPRSPPWSHGRPTWYRSNGLLLRSREYHDGRPRGPLWRGKKLIGKEALFVISGLKRFKDDDEEQKLDSFVKNHVLRLLKMDLIAVLTELERQEETHLALKIFRVIQKQDWYKPDVYLYKDLIIALSRSKMMDEVVKLWEDMKKEELFPDSQTYTEVIRGYLKYGSPSDAMNIYEDMLKSPDPPDELPFRVLLRGLLPHPLLRNKVKKDFEEIFPESHVYDPPEEIFGIR